jgi:hypothetical protein
LPPDHAREIEDGRDHIQRGQEYADEVSAR